MEDITQRRQVAQDVSHVSNKGLIVSLQNGLKGTVSKLEASDVFYVHTKGRGQRSKRKTSAYPSSRRFSSSSSSSSSDESSGDEEEEKMEAQKERLV